jgi:prepilin-type N-terminal cleavage/methylation domain-containing protein
MAFERERGFSLVELVIVMVLAGLLITAGVVFALPWVGREEVRGAAYQVQSHLQLARIHAVSRNRACRFVLDAESGAIQVVDLNDPADGTDDTLVASATLPRTVSFADPSGGTPITLAILAGSTYQATYAADGRVSDGAGTITLSGGDRYERVTLFGAGGLRTETWDGTAWRAGT